MATGYEVRDPGDDRIVAEAVSDLVHGLHEWLRPIALEAVPDRKRDDGYFVGRWSASGRKATREDFVHLVTDRALEVVWEVSSGRGEGRDKAEVQSPGAVDISQIATVFLGYQMRAVAIRNPDGSGRLTVWVKERERQGPRAPVTPTPIRDRSFQVAGPVLDQISVLEPNDLMVLATGKLTSVITDKWKAANFVPRVRDSGCDIRTMGKLQDETWRRRFSGFDYLITSQAVKIDKSNTSQSRYSNAVQYLAPATMAGGPNLCPCHTEGCYGEKGENCIAGTGRLEMAQAVLIARSRFFFGDRAAYKERLVREIEHFRRRSRECGRKLALRLNGTSDLAWEKMADFRDLFTRFADVTFYDYTKVASRIVRDGRQVPLPPNYHLTFSLSEVNAREAEQVIRHTDVNVAVVFDVRLGRGEREPDPLPREWAGRRVVDGDKHDLRFKDPPGVIVGLRAKGHLRASQREEGSPADRFVQRPGEAPLVQLRRRG